jgi:hypothetical protein
MKAEVLLLNSQNGVAESASFEWDIEKPHYLTLHLVSGRSFTASGSDFFESLCAIREHELEPGGIIPLCNGARLDVYPLGMSRSMSGARTASVLKMNQQTQREDLVEIFAPALAGSVATVREQREYFREWFKSVTGHKLG